MGVWQRGRMRQTVNLLYHTMVRIHSLPPNNGLLAHRVEHQTFNLRVLSSSLKQPTK